jgi:hypothetical protein
MPPSTRPERGFVLIGVIIFLFVLTILGMSLYAVSGYEIGFLGQSRDDYQALYDAQGGLELVRERLATDPWRLDSAHEIEGILGVQHAIAFQTHDGGVLDSLGPVDFATDSAVTIVVTANVNGTSRQLSAQFLPNAQGEFYRRLFTISGTGVDIGGPPGPGQPAPTMPGSIYVEKDFFSQIGIRSHTVRLGDNDIVWQQSTDRAWTSQAQWAQNFPVVVTGVPLPDCPTFYQDHQTSLTPAVLASGSQLQFNRHTDPIGYYISPDAPGDYSYRNQGGGLELDVQGTVVWELPQGFRSEQTVTVRRIGTATPTTLVIVASGNPSRGDASNNDPAVGIWFFSGLNVLDGVNVVLVSDGQVNFERNYSTLLPYAAPRLSVFSNRLYLMGPEVQPIGIPIPLIVDTYSHPTDMDAVIADLESASALPNALGGRPQGFSFVPGTWRDLSP